MKKPQILLITFVLIITSFAFSQSGAAKSLEIGNKWVYKTIKLSPDNGDTTNIDYSYAEVIGNEFIKNQKIAVINKVNFFVTTPFGNQADYNKIFSVTENTERELIDFGIDVKIGTFFGEEFVYKNFAKFGLWVMTPYHEHGTYIKGIGLSSFSGDYGASNEEIHMTLLACRINGVDYGDVTYLDVEDNETIPNNYKLTQNYPNPFNPTTQISYELPQDSDVELIIYNSLGAEVNTIINKSQSIGRYTIDWNGLNSYGEQVPGGIYFFTLKTKDFTQTKKMLLLR